MPIKTKAKFNFQKGTMKQVNLKELSWRAADFARHLNMALFNTPYRICSIIDYSRDSRGNRRFRENSERYFSIELYRVIQTPGGIRNALPAGNISVSRGGNSIGMNMYAFTADSSICTDLKTIESRVRDYKF